LSRLTPTRIDGLADLMKKRPDARIQVQAFTNSRGSTAHNQQLSQQRAEAVQQALIERGVPASRISAEGRGEMQPIASNDTAAGREKNRRVEVVVSDAAGHFASAAPLNSKN
jgi:outer membrane protein OmpA-like peptidoglycan-associated protein